MAKKKGNPRGRVGDIGLQSRERELMDTIDRRNEFIAKGYSGIGPPEDPKKKKKGKK